MELNSGFGSKCSKWWVWILILTLILSLYAFGEVLLLEVVGILSSLLKMDINIAVLQRYENKKGQSVYHLATPVKDGYC